MKGVTFKADAPDKDNSESCDHPKQDPENAPHNSRSSNSHNSSSWGVLELQLPEQQSKSDAGGGLVSARSTTHSLGYVQTCKATMKLRGLKYENIFAHNRGQKSDKQKNITANQKKSPTNHQGSTSGMDVEMSTVPEEEGEQLGSQQRNPEQGSETQSSDEALEERLKQVVSEYGETPGLKQRKARHCGRTLGNIVSPQRLVELLETSDPLRMEDHHNCYF